MRIGADAAMRVLSAVRARLHHPAVPLLFQHVVDGHGLRGAGLLGREGDRGVHLFSRKTMDATVTFMEAMFRPWRVDR